MIAYILNFVLCSGVMLGIYYLILSKEAMYRFNRFYLLFSIAFSAVVPLVSFNVPYAIPYVNDVGYATETQRPAPEQSFNTVSNNTLIAEYSANADTGYNYLPHLPFILYGLVAFILLIRFLLIMARIKTVWGASEKVSHLGTTLRLIDEDVTPHSFLRKIFISKNDYQNGIDPKIIVHERAHADQLHSIDIIALELLQIVFWFNPFLLLYRKAITLNHEFLADNAVLSHYNDAPQYQLLLLSKATQSPAYHLNSQFNYLTTKKRLIMMTKITSNQKTWQKKLLILLAVSAAVVVFSEKISATPKMPESISTIVPAKKPLTDTLPAKVVEKLKKWSSIFKSNIKHGTVDAPADVLISYNEILKKNGITITGKKHFNEISATDTAQLRKLFEQMSEEQQNLQFLRFAGPGKPMRRSQVSNQQLKDWQADAKKFGVFIDGKRIKNAELAKYKTSDFDLYFFSRLARNARENDGFSFQANLFTKKWYDNHVKDVLTANQKPRMQQIMVVGDKISSRGAF